jgi:hypothetical protein
MSSSTSKVAYVWNEKAVASPGEIVVRFNWKQTSTMTKEGKKAHESRYVSAPELILSEPAGTTVQNEGWYSFATEAVREYQRASIQEFLTGELDRGEALPTVPAEFFDLDCLMMRWQDEQENSGKGRGALSSEAVAEFFNTLAKPALTLFIVEKRGLTDDTLTETVAKQIAQQVNGYGALFVKLTKRDPISPEHLDYAAKALELIGAETDPVGKRLVKKVWTLQQARNELGGLEAL